MQVAEGGPHSKEMNGGFDLGWVFSEVGFPGRAGKRIPGMFESYRLYNIFNHFHMQKTMHETTQIHLNTSPTCCERFFK